MDYLELMEKYRESMTKSLCSLISIKSVKEDATQSEQDGYLPFGEGVHEAFKYLLSKGKVDGFEVKNVNNYGGHIEFGNGEKIMGILGHLDVVPEGDDWKYPPYNGTIIDGKIFGRGSSDDKGPVMAAYYAMKALKDSGFQPNARVRLILGLDEETEWKGMEYYLQHEAAPDFGFTPDADFPVIHGEKGIVTFQLVKKLAKSNNKGLELRKISGGNASNMVADHARAVVRCEDTEIYNKIRERVALYGEEKLLGKEASIKVKGVGKSLEISCRGVSAHGARPDKGINAISILMDFLKDIDFENEEVNDFINFYNKHIGFELNGESFGCGLSDEPSGKLTLNVGLINGDMESLSLTLNVRYPVTYQCEDVYGGISEIVEKYNFGLIKEKHQKPIYFSKDNPLIEILQDVYKEHTGDMQSQPLVIGGGTYARACDGIVAYGAIFPGQPELAHQVNEYVEIDNLVKAAAIYADAIYRLTK